jgi:1,4-dihydroxy-6-naphthoate synthase
LDNNPKVIRIGHSPDPDDAFMYYGFAKGMVTIEGHELENVLDDIQSLNEKAHSNDPLEVTALSLHAFLELQDKYELLDVGFSVGRNYGPRLVATSPVKLEDLKGKKIALPGPKTSATLAARGLLPEFEEIHYDFDKIIDVVKAGEVDAGLLIHEGQLTYGDHGLHLIADLGVMFAEKHDGLPMPLGVNCVRKDLLPELKKEVEDAYRESVDISLKNREAALEYALDFGRGLDKKLADEFIGMYVNEDTLTLKDDLRQAMEIMRTEYWEKQK